MYSLKKRIARGRGPVSSGQGPHWLVNTGWKERSPHWYSKTWETKAFSNIGLENLYTMANTRCWPGYRSHLFSFAAGQNFNTYQFFFFKFLLFFICLFRAIPRPVDVPRLGVESELQLPAYATATATQDPSHVWDLHRGSQQCWVPNPLSEARDWTRVLKDTNQAPYCWAMTGTPV